MEYSYQSASRLEAIKKRAARCVCKYCGSRLKLHRIVFSEYEDARVEIFCSHCDRIEYGVEPEIYTCARYFVDELGYNGYPDLDESETTRQLNIAKVSEITAWALKNLGFLTEEGFTHAVQMKAALLAECILLTSQDLAEAAISDWSSTEDGR